MRYYWCVSCGYCGEFGFERLKNIKCESCDYEGLTGYEEDEWKELEYDKKHELHKQDPYYNGDLKYKVVKSIK